ncbi:cytochrome ubiquinol oxidase subunit I [Lentzea nigeriaca]|uniref:cytochrome ubiquinol oxidase subunit I n=1 Tax=Lentzea nigeriaca TaxID=1128665 RepID=UPI0019589B57|nr:cytochrome ubiquinol oxidase subunit I [Lentzea nigeriaca]MBM7860644.1 anti-anti-sigma regulatory factor [Lentzea nigeriaca]
MIGDQLALDADVLDHCVVIRPRGVLDRSTYARLRDCMLKHAVEVPRALIVDLSDVTIGTTSALSVFTTVSLSISDWPAVPVLVATGPAHAETLRRAPIRRLPGDVVARVGRHHRDLHDHSSSMLVTASEIDRLIGRYASRPLISMARSTGCVLATMFRLDEQGGVVDARPWAAMFGPSTWAQFVHMWLAAFMVTGFLIASVYAVGMLRGRRDRYHRAGLLIPLTVAALATPAQIGVGDWIANVVADNQPAKLAAMEAQYETTSGAGLSIGGVYRDDELRYAVEIPYALSLLIHHDPDGVVPGLEEVPADERPPVNVVHLAYNAMVGIGTALLLLVAWYGFVWWRRRRLPDTAWFLRAVAVSGVAAVVAMEAGWITTEVGRQPWVVYGILRTADAVSPAPGLGWGLVAVVGVYTVLTAFTVVVLRRLARDQDTPVPQEQR